MEYTDKYWVRVYYNSILSLDKQYAKMIGKAFTGFVNRISTEKHNEVFDFKEEIGYKKVTVVREGGKYIMSNTKNNHVKEMIKTMNMSLSLMGLGPEYYGNNKK